MGVRLLSSTRGSRICSEVCRAYVVSGYAVSGGNAAVKQLGQIDVVFVTIVFFFSFFFCDHLTRSGGRLICSGE